MFVRDLYVKFSFHDKKHSMYNPKSNNTQNLGKLTLYVIEIEMSMLPIAT